MGHNIMKCPNCGTVNPPGEEFCSNCGAYLDPTHTAGSATMISSANVAPSGTATDASSVPLSGTSGNLRTLAPGSTLQNGRYLVERVLGQGGMGAALLAKDTRVSNKLVV